MDIKTEDPLTHSDLSMVCIKQTTIQIGHVIIDTCNVGWHGDWDMKHFDTSSDLFLKR